MQLISPPRQSAQFHQVNTLQQLQQKPASLQSDSIQLRFGSERKDQETLLLLRKELRKAKHERQIEPKDLLGPCDGEIFSKGFKQGLTIDEIIEQSATEFVHEDMQRTLNYDWEGKTVREHLEAERDLLIRIGELKKEITALESKVTLPLPKIVGPITQAKMDSLVADLIQYFDNDPQWYEGAHFLDKANVKRELVRSMVMKEDEEFSLEDVVKPYSRADVYENEYFHGTSRSAAEAIKNQGFNLLNNRLDTKGGFMQIVGSKELGNAVYFALQKSGTDTYQNIHAEGGGLVKVRLKKSAQVGKITPKMGQYFSTIFANVVQAYLSQDDPNPLAKVDERLSTILKWELQKRFFQQRGYDAVINPASILSPNTYLAVFNPEAMEIQ